MSCVLLSPGGRPSFPLPSLDGMSGAGVVRLACSVLGGQLSFADLPEFFAGELLADIRAQGVTDLAGVAAYLLGRFPDDMSSEAGDDVGGTVRADNVAYLSRQIRDVHIRVGDCISSRVAAAEKRGEAKKGQEFQKRILVNNLDVGVSNHTICHTLLVDAIYNLRLNQLPSHLYHRVLLQFQLQFHVVLL